MVQRLFETRSHAWREAGLAKELSARAVKRARIQRFVLVPIGITIYVL
jgi:small conductance mechanosensitive channel